MKRRSLCRSVFIISLFTFAQACSGCDEGRGGKNDNNTNGGTNNTNNATNNVGTNNSNGATNGETNNCVSETAAEFCERLEKTCGMVTDTDNCGITVTHPCGDCSDPQTCGGGGEDNVCGCTPQTTAEICQNEMKDCGVVDTTDGCGAPVSVDCGTCPNGGICGAATENVCDCPCDIDGTCVPEGMPNPANPCEVCDPTRATDAWSASAEGAACDDGLDCTVGSTCNADGQCEPADLALGTCLVDGVCYSNGTSSPTNPCTMCDPAQDTTDFSEVGDGVVCDDQLACTGGDVCQGGECIGSNVVLGTCAIDGACYNQGDTNPSNGCEVCDPANDLTGWSDAAVGLACDDGLLCTSNTVCDGGGACVGVIAIGACAIDGACYNDGDSNPNSPCETCNSGNVQDDWSDAANGTACDDGLACTANDACDGGDCLGMLDATSCLIDGTCYSAQEAPATEPCRFCDPNQERRDWSFLPGGTICDDRLICTSDGSCDGDGECLIGAVIPGNCAIDGACYAAGDVNPGNPCEVCQPALELTAWSPNTGAVCNDGLTCTSSDTCDANGECLGMVATDRCAIGGACFALGDLNPSNECEVCNSNLVTTDWSTVAQGTSCDDGLACTNGDTCDFGTCVAGTQTAGTCAIGNACWNDGDINPNNPCEICDATNDAQDWSANDGDICEDGDGLACTGICGGRQCTSDLRAGSCAIDGACYAAGDLNPMGECQVCDPQNDTQDWSVAPDLAACGVTGTDICCGGVCTAGNSCP